MRRLACLSLLAACLCPPPAAAGSFARAPLEDVGFPFWCDWGYDWDERCYRDDIARLPVGGVADKVWRGAVRFSLDALPGGARANEPAAAGGGQRHAASRDRQARRRMFRSCASKARGCHAH